MSTASVSPVASRICRRVIGAGEISHVNARRVSRAKTSQTPRSYTRAARIGNTVTLEQNLRALLSPSSALVERARASPPDYVATRHLFAGNSASERVQRAYGWLESNFAWSHHFQRVATTHNATEAGTIFDSLNTLILRTARREVVSCTVARASL